jgi:hypothetical protein
MPDPSSNLSMFGQATSQPTPVNPSLLATMGPQFQQMYGQLPNAGASSGYRGWNGQAPQFNQYAPVNNPIPQPTVPAAQLPTAAPLPTQPRAPFSSIGQLQNAFPVAPAGALPAGTQQNLMALLQALGINPSHINLAAGVNGGAAASAGATPGQGGGGSNGTGGPGGPRANPGSAGTSLGGGGWGYGSLSGIGSPGYGIGTYGNLGLTALGMAAGIPGLATAADTLAGVTQANNDLNAVSAPSLSVRDMLSAALNNASWGWAGTSVADAQTNAALKSANAVQSANPVTSAIDLGINAGSPAGFDNGGFGSSRGVGIGGGIGGPGASIGDGTGSTGVGIGVGGVGGVGGDAGGASSGGGGAIGGGEGGNSGGGPGGGDTGHY